MTSDQSQSQSQAQSESNQKHGRSAARRLSEIPTGISAIFNPRKLRRGSQHPSVVVTDDDSEDFKSGGPYYDRSVSFAPNTRGGSGANMNFGGGESRGGGGNRGIGSAGSCGTSSSSVPLLADVQAQSDRAIVTIESTLLHHQSSLDRPGYGPSSGIHNNNNNPSSGPGTGTSLKPIAKTFATIRRAIFSKTARKLCCGLFLSIVVGLCWTITIHSIKRAYITTVLIPSSSSDIITLHPMPGYEYHGLGHEGGLKVASGNSIISSTPSPSPQLTPFQNSLPNIWEDIILQNHHQTPTVRSHTTGFTNELVYDAPFFTAWLFTISTILFYPIHQITVRFCSCMGRKGARNMSRSISDAVQGFRERGMTIFQFLGRCGALCILWLLTNYLFFSALRILRATEVMALFATTTSFSYLLSWVVLHQQFVGLRILAVILSNMGIALLAYMDGQTHKSPTVGYVILAAASAGFAAVYKVTLKKSFGYNATVSQQVALIFSVVGLLSIVLLWPICITLYFTGVEVIQWSYVPWDLIGEGAICYLLVAMLENFGVTCTFEFFITIGILICIPFSTVLDIQLYNAEFYEMRLAGIITISIGFLVVLLPENWPDYITRCIRLFRKPPPEDDEPPTRYSTAIHRLSRAGLDHHAVHHNQHNYNYNSSHSNSAHSSAHSHGYGGHGGSYPLHQYERGNHHHHRASISSFNPLHAFSNHHF